MSRADQRPYEKFKCIVRLLEILEYKYLYYTHSALFETKMLQMFFLISKLLKIILRIFQIIWSFSIWKIFELCIGYQKISQR